MRRLSKAWPIAASSSLLLAAFPPLNLGLLVFVALVPWLLSLRGSSAWGAFRSGYVFGVLFWLGQMHWLPVLTYRWTGSLGLALVPYALAPLVGALYFAGAACLFRLCWRAERPLWIAPIWAGVEVIRSYIPELAFPWGLLSGPLASFPPLIQLAYFGTVYAVSAWVAMVNVLFALYVSHGWVPRLRFAALFCVAMAGIALVRYSMPVRGQVRTITVGQPGVNLAFGDPSEKIAKVEGPVRRLISQAADQRSSLLVLPEGLVSGDGSFPPVVPFELRPDVPVLFGGPRGRSPTYQSAFAYDGQWKYADKTRLVIFGEYVPFRDKLPFLSSFQLPGSDLTAAERASIVQVGGLKVGPLLCFEALFYDVALQQAKNGAQLLAIMSIDDWYMGTGAPEQLRSGAIWRAVETGLPVVRAASLGHSLAVDPRGRVVAEAPLGQTVALKADVPIPDDPRRFPPAEAVPHLLAASVVVPLAFVRRVLVEKA